MKSSYQVALLFILLASKLSSGEIVLTNDGQIEGTVISTRLGTNFHAFYQIPFAEPPIGVLRFKDPLPVQPWAGVRDGMLPGPMCVQAYALVDLEMSEDCLQLNIFTKNLTDSKPVIFYIHGGAFTIGTGLAEGPDYLMDRDLVVVTINYRLGALGFLSTGTKDVPGNAGLKDQAMALRWVHQNIAKFGGDPNKITIAGQSAGASSVAGFMVSPMVKDLFTGVIAISGPVAGLNTLRSEYLDVVKEMSANLTCTTDKVEDMIECLQTKQPHDIVRYRLFANFPECQIVIFMPVVEPDFGQERFFADDFFHLVQSGNFTRVPIIVGITANEFSDNVPKLLNSPGLKTMNENFDEIAPYCFLYEAKTEKSKAMGKVLRESYLPLDTIDARSFDGLNNLFSDSIIGYNVHRFAHLAAHFTDVYYYKFTYIGRYSLFNYPRDKPYGVQHTDDLQYAIHAAYVGPLIQVTDPENFMVERMTSIYEHFAHTGNPNYDPDNMNWPKLNNETEFYMDIGTHLIEKHGMNLERYTIWERLEISSANSTKFSIVLLLVMAIKLICF